MALKSLRSRFRNLMYTPAPNMNNNTHPYTIDLSMIFFFFTIVKKYSRILPYVYRLLYSCATQMQQIVVTIIYNKYKFKYKYSNYYLNGFIVTTICCICVAQEYNNLYT